MQLFHLRDETEPSPRVLEKRFRVAHRIRSSHNLPVRGESSGAHVLQTLWGPGILPAEIEPRLLWRDNLLRQELGEKD